MRIPRPGRPGDAADRRTAPVSASLRRMPAIEDAAVPAALIEPLRDLLHEWEHGEYSATEAEPGIAYCAAELRRVLMHWRLPSPDGCRWCCQSTPPHLRGSGHKNCRQP